MQFLFIEKVSPHKPLEIQRHQSQKEIQKPKKNHS